MTIACPDCGTLEDLLPLRDGDKAVCILCRSELERTAGRSLTAALACALATLLLLIPANLLPLISVDLMGMHSRNVIFRGVELLWLHGWLLLAGLTGIMVVVLPALRFLLLAGVLATLRFGGRPRWLGPAFRWAIILDQWALLDVYMLASFVGYFRLVSVSEAHVVVGTGGLCFLAAALLTMLSRAALDRRTVWRAIHPDLPAQAGSAYISCIACDMIQPVTAAGSPCPRCRATLHPRKPGAVPNTAALVVAAIALLFPAYLLPMNVSQQIGSVHRYTIFTGIKDLFGAGLWELGMIVFCTSFLFPCSKILLVAWCTLSAWRGWPRHRGRQTKLLRIVGEAGRWSNTDPLTIVFFVPLMNFQPLATSDAGWGATAFLLMTVLTMLSTATFDPRLLWDIPETRRHGPA